MAAPWGNLPRRSKPDGAFVLTALGGLLPDGNANQKLVKQGWCWWYRKYAPGNTMLEGLEKEAREDRRGLWADPGPVPPWEWRKRKER
jgi:endonuclease YncB( thermonuclease family)